MKVRDMQACMAWCDALERLFPKRPLFRGDAPALWTPNLIGYILPSVGRDMGVLCRFAQA
jgi:hypothetical protein